MLALPLLDALDGEQEIGVLRHISRYIDHACGAHKFLRRNFVHAAVRQVLAAYPMDRRIKMRTGMLAGLKAVPVPSRAAIVIMRKLPDLKRRRVVPLRRQRQQRRLRTQRLGKVDDAQGAAVELGYKFNKDIGHLHDPSALGELLDVPLELKPVLEKLTKS